MFVCLVSFLNFFLKCTPFLFSCMVIQIAAHTCIWEPRIFHFAFTAGLCVCAASCLPSSSSLTIFLSLVLIHHILIYGFLPISFFTTSFATPGRCDLNNCYALLLTNALQLKLFQPNKAGQIMTSLANGTFPRS